MFSKVTASLVAQRVKCLPAMQEIQVWSLGQEDLLEKEMATHSGTLAWNISWTEKPGRLQSMGSQRVRHDWPTSLSLLSFQSDCTIYIPTSKVWGFQSLHISINNCNQLSLLQQHCKYKVQSLCDYNFYFPNDKMFSIFSCASSPFEHLLFSVNTISKKLRTK